LHVLEVDGGAGEIPMTDYVFNEMQRVGLESLKTLQTQLREKCDGKVDIYTQLRIGQIKPAIEAFTETIHPFLVIMSARSLLNLPVPLIIVPQEAAFHPIKKIALACDIDDICGGLPIKPAFLNELSETFNAGFDLVNINTSRQAVNERALFSYETWKSQFHELFPEVNFIETGKVQDGIAQYLEHNDADLLLVFPKDHGFFEFHVSQAKKIALHSRIPVMSIHER